MGFAVKKIKAIHFKNGIFVIVEHSKSIEYTHSIDGAEKEAESVIDEWGKLIKNDVSWWDEDYHDFSLMGGRILIGNRNSGIISFLKVDGVEIVSNDLVGISTEWLLHHLNSIAVHGVDGFIEHYKVVVNNKIDLTKKEITETISNISSLPPESNMLRSKYTDIINSLRDELKKLGDIAFVLSSFMVLGIENEKIMSAYNEVVSMFV